MNDAVTARIRENPKYHELVAKRGKYAWSMAAVVLVIFYGFAMTVAFNPAVLGQPSGDGLMTKGILFIFFMFVFFWVLTAVFVRRANTEFDALTKEIVAEAWKEVRK